MDAFPQEFVASTSAVSGITFAGNVIECSSAIQVGRSDEPGSKGLEDKSQGVLGPTMVFESNRIQTFPLKLSALLFQH